MKNSTRCLAAVCGLLLAASGSPLLAQGNKALIDALVKKGVLSSKEAAEIQADMAAQYENGPEGRIELSKHVTKLKLYGQARWRYQWNEASTQPPISPTPGAPIPNPSPQQDFDQSRARYMFRVGATYDFTDNFRSGIEFASSTVNDSYNQTIGNGYGKFGVNLSLLYLQWEATDWLTLTGGKQLNPLYTTSLVWDSDINPEGVTEEMWWDVTDAFGIGLTAGQWVYMNDTASPFVEDAFENTLPFNTEDEIIWQFVQQIPMQYRFLEYETVQEPSDDPKDMKAMRTVTRAKEIAKITFAPGFMTYTTGSTLGVSTSSPAFANINGSEYLNIVTAPGDVKWKVGKVPMTFYWDFAWNITGEERVQDLYLQPINGGAAAGAVSAAYRNINLDLSDSIAWLAGIKFGQNKKKGDWSLAFDYRTIGVGSIDPNLSDSDFGLGQLNQQGFRVAAEYNFTDFLTGAVTYFNSWNYKEDLWFPPGTIGSGTGVGGSSNNNLTGANGIQIVQVDLKWKF